MRIKAPDYFPSELTTNNNRINAYPFVAYNLLDLLSIPQSGGKNVKTFRGDQ